MVQNGQDDIWSEECYLNDDCMEQGNPCQANDVNLVGAYIADSLGNPVLVCETGNPQSVYLWGTFQNGTGTDRYAIRSRTEIWLDGAFSQELISCSFDQLTPGTEDVALLGTFTYTCGQQVQLLNTWIGWSTSAAVCSDAMDPDYIEMCGEYPPAKCSKQLDFLTFLSCNFDYGCGVLTDTSTEICFFDLTIGGTPPYTYLWHFGDGDSSTEMNPCHIYDATTGVFEVSLLVTDADSVQAGAVLPVDLEALNCCSLDLVCPESPMQVYDCVSDVPEQSADAITFLDMCGLPDVAISDDTSGIGCAGDTLVVTRTYIITDGMSVDTCTQFFRVVDDIPPSLDCPDAVTVNCGDSTDPMFTGMPALASDNCDPMPTITYSDNINSGSCPQEQLIERSWEISDACGNTSVCVQTISVLDVIPPDITCPPDITLEEGESTDPANTGTATATDNCDGSPFVTYADNTSPGGCRIYRTWTAEDACGNLSSCRQIIMVPDTMPFELVCPPDLTVSCSVDPDEIPVISDTTLCVSVTVTHFDDVVYAGNCDNEIISKIIRTYVAQDADGNITTCTQMISFTPEDLMDVVFPPNLQGNDALACYPPPDTSPVSTGYPEINGIPVLSGQFCNISATYSDVTADLCSSGYKIFRTWVVTDWCNGNAMIDSVQIIEVVDKTPPVVDAPDSLTVSAGPDCVADVLLPPAGIMEDCATEIDVRIQSMFGTIMNNGGTIPDVPLGVFNVVYVATNDCNLEGRDTTVVRVIDDTPPTPVCKSVVVVPVSSNGMSLVQASSFNGGSEDNCGEVYFKARRMDVPQGFDCFADGNPEYLFDDYVKFCCGDVGNENLMVFLRVYDEEPVPGPVENDYLEGHYADCMLQVQVQDKTPPQIICPSDLTISCLFAFDPNNLSVFGSVVTDPADRQQICLDDTGNPGTDGLTCVGLDGLASDNCSVVVEEEPAVEVNAVCGTGSITRTFTATDPGGLTASCQQVITIINYTPFSESDITWPPDYTTYDVCEVAQLDPEDLPAPYDVPVLVEDECDLATYTHEDLVFDFSSTHQACFKILRTWTVLDWCQYQSGGSAGLWTHTQIIKVMNTVAPEITLTDQEQIQCTDDPACGPGHFTLGASATDDCSAPDALRWTISVDENNDGSLDQVFHPSNGPQVSQPVLLPLGEHRILYSVEDYCGNRTTQEQYLTVISCKTPSAKCLNLTTSLMPMDTDGDGIADWGMVTVFARDLDGGSDHPCGYPVSVAFSSDVNDTTRTFDCTDLGVNAVDLWVIDPYGNTDYCTVSVTIQDNFDVCDTEPKPHATISGTIATSLTEFVSDVAVSLAGSNFPSQMTSADGNYSFPPMPFGGSYDVSPRLNTDYKKGVSTLDLILLQKHLLGIQPLTDPYKIIAADANHSQTLSAMDIVQLRRLILGVTDTLPNNTSWRFVDSGYHFIDPSNPLQETFPESYHIAGLSSDMPNIDFVAVKIGDLNGSVMQDLQDGNIAFRNALPKLSIWATDKLFQDGESVLISLHCEKLSTTEGVQFTLQWDPAQYDVHPVSGNGVLNESNWNTGMLNNGALPVSWTRYDVGDTKDTDILLTLEITAHGKTRLGDDGLTIGSDITMSEGQRIDGVRVQPELHCIPASGRSSGMIVYQNRPNPFTRKTLIPVVLPEPVQVTIDVYSVEGSQVYHQTIDGKKGYNEFMIDAAALHGQGVFTYRISTATEYRTLRMIVVGE